MTTNDLLNLSFNDFNQLSEKELRKTVKVLADTANKRLARLEKAGYNTPATAYVDRSGGKFTTAGKSINQLRAEYTRVKGFLQSKTGSIKGATKVYKQTYETLQAHGIEIKKEDIGRIFSLYDKLKEMDSSIAEKNLKYNIIRKIHSEMENNKGISNEEILSKLQNNLNEIYEEEAEQYGEYGDFGASKFFEIDDME